MQQWEDDTMSKPAKMGKLVEFYDIFCNPLRLSSTGDWEPQNAWIRHQGLTVWSRWWFNAQWCIWSEIPATDESDILITISNVKQSISTIIFRCALSWMTTTAARHTLADYSFLWSPIEVYTLDDILFNIFAKVYQWFPVKLSSAFSGDLTITFPAYKNNLPDARSEIHIYRIIIYQVHHDPKLPVSCYRQTESLTMMKPLKMPLEISSRHSLLLE